MQMETQRVRAKCKSVPRHVFARDSDLVPRYVSRASQVIPHPREMVWKTQQIFPNVNTTVPVAPCIPPVPFLTWQQFNSLCAIFFHVCCQISIYTKFMFFQGLIRLKVQILQDNRRTQQIQKALMQIFMDPMNSSRANAELGLRGI